ncbi:hypothetical protein os4_36220 (plasmid) [Comamonadaceae bacterium OS-4]|nr:hypothetical protein os4_36220 [Comamonadaceae bacterium OS-4]
MRANRNFSLVALIATVSLAAHAQYAPGNPTASGAVAPQQAQAMGAAPAAAVATGVQAAPVAPAASASIARPSDTIGEAADRQRMARMLQSQNKPGLANTPIGVQPTTPVIGGINVQHTQPGGVASVPKPQQPDMALVEIARGPMATVVSIEVNGVDRRVAEGDDLGNGWKVKHVGRFTVELEEVPTKTNQDSSGAGASKSKTKAKAASAKKLKTRTLELKSVGPAAGDLSRPMAAR